MLQRLLVVPAVLAALLAGCATGSLTDLHQPISIATRTASGALSGVDCRLHNGRGSWQLSAPGTVAVERSTSDLNIRCDKRGLPPALLAVRARPADPAGDAAAALPSYPAQLVVEFSDLTPPEEPPSIRHAFESIAQAARIEELAPAARRPRPSAPPESPPLAPVAEARGTPSDPAGPTAPQQARTPAIVPTALVDEPPAAKADPAPAAGSGAVHTPPAEGAASTGVANAAPNPEPSPAAPQAAPAPSTAEEPDLALVPVVEVGAPRSKAEVEGEAAAAALSALRCTPAVPPRKFRQQQGAGHYEAFCTDGRLFHIVCTDGACRPRTGRD